MWQQWIDEIPGWRIPVLIGRGCIFECSYCCNHAIKRLAADPYARSRSPENILDEIKSIAVDFPGKRNIYFEVESFGTNKDWAIALCAALADYNNELAEPFSFGVNLRLTVDTKFESFFAALKKANFQFVNIGLESGSERVRRKILKRDYANQDIINAVSLAKKHGIKVTLYNIVGVPGETLADFKETVRINRICQPERHLTSIFYPYPGTELYQRCEKEGLLKRNYKIYMERRGTILRILEFTEKQIQRSYLWFDYYVYKGHEAMHRILFRVLVRYLTSRYYLNAALRKLTSLPFLRNLGLVFIQKV